MTARNRRIAFVSAVLCTGVIVGAAIVAFSPVLTVRSPAQAVADAAPPAPSLVTADVESRRLVQKMVLRGRVVAGKPELLRLPSASGHAGRAVVTAVYKHPGDKLRNGDVLLEVAGRPVFAMHGAFPAYRDITARADGPDVMQLQRALKAVGFNLNADGEFGANSQDALGQFYADRGYDAPTGLTNPQEQVEAAEAALARARQEWRRAMAGRDGSETRSSALAAFELAAQEVTEVRLQAGPALPMSEVIFLDLRGSERRVSKNLVSVGTVLGAGSPLFDLATQFAAIQVAAPQSAERWLSEGGRAQAIDELTGRIYALEAEPTASKRAGGSSRGMLLRGKDRLPGGLKRSLKVVVSGRRSRTKSLCVPVTAVYSRADGTRFVTVRKVAGGTADVLVETGISVEGWVAIRAAPGDLAAGDAVVVGIERATGAVDGAGDSTP